VSPSTKTVTCNSVLSWVLESGWVTLLFEGPSLRKVQACVVPTWAQWDQRVKSEPLPLARSVLLLTFRAGHPVSLWGSRCWLACLPSLGGFLAKSPEPRQKKCLANRGMMGPFWSARVRVRLGIFPSLSSKYFPPEAGLRLNCEATGQVSVSTQTGRGLA
jgi:hypothetical protein